ncbi:DEKNAAC103438 [Brettanomyces naardenensis]|uniref:DEKNAAC103438 n=1 Tax=Brettanomyces naardenensis TaxID=13370 RepID=A0A448YNK6_BRENA|nr:DEKNAAC103438 [Brettanomyces naardenensis]
MARVVTRKRKANAAIATKARKASKVSKGKSSKISKPSRTYKKRKTITKTPSRRPSPSSPVSSQDEEPLFDNINVDDDDDASDITSSSEFDDMSEVKLNKDGTRRRKRYSKRDFRSCFNSFFQQVNCITHPSTVKMDIDSEMKLQRQRRLIELDRLQADSDDEDDLADLEDCLELSEPPKKVHRKKRAAAPLEDVESISQLTTELEPVDSIIRQAKDLCAGEDSDFFKMANTDSLIDAAPTLSTPTIARHQRRRNTLSSGDAHCSADASDDCDLISATSSFKLLGNRPQQQSYSAPQTSASSFITAPDSDIRLADYLNIDVPTEEDYGNRFGHNTVFAYRYNSDNLNLALVDDAESQVVDSRRSKALNKRALFYGNSQAMVSDENSISIHDFLN